MPKTKSAPTADEEKLRHLAELMIDKRYMTDQECALVDAHRDDVARMVVQIENERASAPIETEPPLRAVGYHVLIRPPKRASETDGGILLPDTVDNFSFYGRVIAVGDKVTEVKVGDLVVYVKAGADQVEMDKFSKRRDALGEGFIAATEAMVQAVLSEPYAEKLGLRIKDIADE